MRLSNPRCFRLQEERKKRENSYALRKGERGKRMAVAEKSGNGKSQSGFSIRGPWKGTPRATMEKAALWGKKGPHKSMVRGKRLSKEPSLGRQTSTVEDIVLSRKRLDGFDSKA